MKRFFVVAGLSLVLVAVLSLVIGCGGNDTSNAKEYMQEGDRLVSEIEANSQALMEDISDVFYQVSDIESFMQAVEEAKDLTAQLRDQADEGIAEFKKIAGLEGVQDYKDYADLKVQAGEKYKEMLDTIDEFLDEMTDLLESGTADEEAINELVQSFQTEIEELGSEMDDIESEAEALKEDKNL